MKFARPATKLAALAVVGVTALAACGSSGGGGGSGNPTIKGAFGSVPAASGTAKSGGTLTVAEGPGQAPTWILPVTPSANSSVYTSYSFQYEMFRPLFWFVNGVAPKETPSMSLASDPTWSNGNKTVTVKMKGWKWSDGQPITSKDAEFWIDEIAAAVKESPANWGNYTPKLGIPDAVASMSTPDSSTLVINLKSAVNPTWFLEDSLGGVQPMPSHVWAKASANGPILDFTNPANAKKIYDFLAKQSKSVTTYASNPLWQTVDGPYKLTSFNNTSGAFTMSPNAAYSGPHATHVSKLQAVPFTSDTAEFNAIKSGSIDSGYVPLTDLPQVNSVKTNYNVFGYPGFGFNYVTYNFKDTTGNFNNIIKQLYIRQAFAHLEDEAGYIKAFFHGAGGPGYGPVPAIPATEFTPTNALTNPYPFSVSAAVNLLKSHGWTVNPGFNITLKSDNFNHMIATYYDGASPKTINDWAMEDFGGFSIYSYPTTNGIFNSTGSFNIGLYSDPKADSLILASTTSSDPKAVQKEAAYLTQQQPALFQPNVDNIWVWKKTISGQPESFESLTQDQLNPEFWYVKK